MAGDWLKVEANTPDKEEVLAITARMGWEDADLTLGKLFRLWRWFDQNTVDGNARHVTTALLDRIVGVTGFCEAVAFVGWLTVGEHGITLPNFDRHNGKTAKTRALTAKRVAKHKHLQEGNGQLTLGALPREEKSREEAIEPSGSIATRERATSRFDEFWSVYPVKKGKAAAEKTWRSRNLDALAETILVDVETRLREDRQWREGFIPHGSTYLNQRVWLDEIDRRPMRATPDNHAAAERWAKGEAGQ